MKDIVKRLILKLPDNRYLNKINTIAMFRVAHKRWPQRDSGMISDYLYFLRAEPHLDPSIGLRRRVTDKLLAKEYCQELLGEDIAPRTIMAFRDPGEVVEGLEAEECVIKPAHAGGGIVLYHPGGRVSGDNLARMRSWFDIDVYRKQARHPNYKGVRPGVLCEELIAPASEIKDYKVLCYGGRARMIQVDVGRHTEHRRRLYYRDWTPFPYAYNKPLAEPEPAPSLLGSMLEYADKLSAGFAFIRVDFYLAQGRVWFGEFGNYPDAGHGRFESPEAEREFSEKMFNDG